MTQLPSPQRMAQDPKDLRRVRPKTYSVAVYLVVVVVALQAVMLVSIFWLRAMVVSVKVNVPKPATSVAVAPTPALPPVIPEHDMATLPSLSATMNRAPRLSVPGLSDKLEQIGALNDQAQAFLHQHAVDSAAETLLKAEDIDPRNPTTLKNLAEVTYLLNDPVKSKIYWQRLVDLGQAVGTVYGVAKDHVVLLSGPEASPLSNPCPYPRQVYVESVEKTPVETVNGKAQFHLRATLMRKNTKMIAFDQKKLQPYVIFYQQMPDGSLVPDLGQTKGSFDDTFLFWNGKLSETFGVDYLMPIPGAAGPNQTTLGEYYGFVIGIYYDKELQDTRSEPADLINRIPLPEAIE